MKLTELLGETASCGGTGAGSIAGGPNMGLGAGNPAASIYAPIKRHRVNRKKKAKPVKEEINIINRSPEEIALNAEVPWQHKIAIKFHKEHIKNIETGKNSLKPEAIAAAQAHRRALWSHKDAFDAITALEKEQIDPLDLAYGTPEDAVADVSYAADVATRNALEAEAAFSVKYNLRENQNFNQAPLNFKSKVISKFTKQIGGAEIVDGKVEYYLNNELVATVIDRIIQENGMVRFNTSKSLSGFKRTKKISFNRHNIARVYGFDPRKFDMWCMQRYQLNYGTWPGSKEAVLKNITKVAEMYKKNNEE